MADTPDYLQIALTAVSTIAAAASAYFAMRSAKISANQTNHLITAGRPYLSFENVQLQPPKPIRSPNGQMIQPPPNVGILSGVCKNLGQRQAVDVKTKAVFLTPSKSAVFGVVEFEMADDFPPGAEWNVELGDQEFKSADHPGFFVILASKYSDPILSDTYNQVFVMRFRGMQAGLVHSDLIPATREEKRDLITIARMELAEFV